MEVDLVMEYKGLSNPVTKYGSVHGSAYPMIVNGAPEEDHFVSVFSDPVGATADVVIMNDVGEALKYFAWESPCYRATPMAIGTFGERALDM
jgi:hypothetical protein